MDIDEQLINQNTESLEAEKAGEFRAATRGGMQERGENEQASFRERIQQKKGLNITNEKRAEELILRDSPFRQMTDGFLKGAWENLITSWGLTLLYIDAHVFLSKVFGPSAFRELGEEWIPASIKKLGDGKTKQAASLLRIVEGAGCGCLNLGCLFLILFIATLISIIGSILSGDLSFIWELFKGAILDLKNIFS